MLHNSTLCLVNSFAARKLQDKARLVTGLSDRLASVESELDQTKRTVDDNDSELKVNPNIAH